MNSTTPHGRAALTVALTFALSAAAQRAEAAGAGNDEPNELEEVTITAERRAESPQQMAVSVVAFSNDQLRERGIDNIADLQAQVPSVSFVETGTKYLNIRGIGLNESRPNQTTGVASYIDGAYIAREFTADDAFFDMQSVSVLRGPQGTYSGQNATGGAVFVVTNAPDPTRTEGYVQQSLGAYDYRRTEAAISTPLSDTLAFRTSLLTETRDSFTTNRGIYGSNPDESSQPGNRNRLIGRAQFLWTPLDTVELRLIYQNSRRQNDGIAFQPNTTAAWQRPYTANYDYAQLDDNHYGRTTALLDWQANDDFKIHVVSAYQTMEQHQRTDGDATSPFINPTAQQQAADTQVHDRYSTHEIDFLSTGADRLQWTTGLAVLNYHQSSRTQNVTYNATTNPALNPDFSSAGFVSVTRTYRKNYAAFGEVSYDFTPQWQIKLGARYNKDEVGLQSGSYSQPGGPLSSRTATGPNEPSYSAGTGRLLLNWRPSDTDLLYATVSRGYKPGGWTSNVGPATSANRYDAEYVLNYEVGWKATQFDGHLVSAFDAFYMDYEGFQATIATDPQNPTSTRTYNVPETTIKGFEGQLQLLAGGLDLSLSFALLDGKYGNLGLFMPAGTAGSTQTAPVYINLDGRTIDYMPELSGTVAAQYVFRLGERGMLIPRIQWTYQGGQWTSFYNQPYQYMPAYALGSARLTYRPNDSLEIQGYVSNLTDKLYITYAGSAGGSSSPLVVFGAPRQWGLSLSYRF